MTIQTYYLPLYAVPMERQRITKTGHCYTPTKTRDFMKECKLYLRAGHNGEPVSQAVKVEINFFKKREPVNKNYGDIDNLAKSVMDAMTGIVYTDDKYVTELIVKKYWSTAASIVIKVTVL